jgi:hypothetical protein
METVKFLAGPAGCGLGAILLLLTSTGCVGYVDGPRAGVYAAPPVVEAGGEFSDDYVYYPGYEVYYNSRRHQYASLDHGNWVAQSAPRGVSVNVLLASPSVRMNFHDSPALHHAAMVQQYPKNWKSPGTPAGRQEDHPDGRRDAHVENNGR